MSTPKPSSLDRSTQPNLVLLQGILEGFVDGILILTRQGQWVYGNDCARWICQQFEHDRALPNAVPSTIWQACQTLIAGRPESNHSVAFELDVALDRVTTFRVRARWLPLEDARSPYLLVLIENCRQSLHSRAIADAQKYHLTPRQAEVWMLHCMGFSYREIASQLYISLNTVKRHVKDIHIKQRQILEAS